jgi:hypothetical protein
MGISEHNITIPYTVDHIFDRQLVINMLNYEEHVATSDEGQQRYRNKLNRPTISLDNEYAFNRMTLQHFGFNTDNNSVNNYRSIFRTYYHSPDDYDKEVINASYYMRNNRCIYYTSPILHIGDVIPDCPLLELDGTTNTSLYDIISGSRSTLICAFSNS